MTRSINLCLLTALFVACQTPKTTSTEKAVPKKETKMAAAKSSKKPVEKRQADFKWYKADESYMETQPGDYLVEFGQSLADDNEGGERVTAEADGTNRVFVIYRSDKEKEIIREYTKNPSREAIFSHGVFLGKATYNKPFRWIWRPTGYTPGDFAQDTCDGSPTILDDMARTKSKAGWSGINMEGLHVPHACFWSYQPVRVTEDGNEIWKVKDYSLPKSTVGSDGISNEGTSP